MLPQVQTVPSAFRATEKSVPAATCGYATLSSPTAKSDGRTSTFTRPVVSGSFAIDTIIYVVPTPTGLISPVLAFTISTTLFNPSYVCHNNSASVPSPVPVSNTLNESTDGAGNVSFGPPTFNEYRYLSIDR